MRGRPVRENGQSASCAADVAGIMPAVSTVSEWERLNKKLDVEVRGLLAEGFDVEFV